MSLKSKYHRLEKSLYVARHLLLDRAFVPPMNILFSPSPWERELVRIFRHTRHTVSFAELNGSNGASFDLAIPLTIGDSKSLFNNPDLYPNNRYTLPEAGIVDLLDDKPRFNKKLSDMGHGRYIPSGDGRNLPLMVKVNSGYYGDGCHVLRTEEDRVLHQDKLASPDYFTQEMIVGKREYAIHILIRNGRIIKSLGVEYRFDHPLPIKGQDAPREVVLVNDPYLRVWESILAELGYEGLCCVNYKMKDGVPLLLEINPRFGGSLATFFISFLRHF